MPQLDNLDVTLTVEQNLLVFAHLYRIGRHERHEAIERSLELANLVDRRDTRVDKLSGGMRRRLLIARALVHRPRLVLMDEPTVGLDPQVRQQLWALIDQLRSEGTTILMSTHYIEEAQRLADTVLIMSHGAGGRPRQAVRARRASTRGARCSRSTGRRRGWPRSSPTRRASGLKTRRTGTSVSILGVDGERLRRLRGRAAAGEPRGRLRPARPARRSADGDGGPYRRSIGRLERPALTGVLVREVVNFSSYWRVGDVLLDGRADDLPARVRLRLRLAREHDQRLRLRRVRRHGDVATAVLFSSAFAAMFGTFVKYQFQRTYDAILAAPVDTEELVTAEALWIATRAGVYGCVPMVVAILFGLDPAWGMLAVPFIALAERPRLGVLRDHDRRLREGDRELQLRRQRRADAALPRSPARSSRWAACPSGSRCSPQFNPLHQTVELVRDAVLFGFEWVRSGPRRLPRPLRLDHVAARDSRDGAEADRLSEPEYRGRAVGRGRPPAPAAGCSATRR